MNYHIKIYPKHCTIGKAKTSQECNEIYESEKKKKHWMQNFSWKMPQKTKRKKLPFNYEFSYYSWETIKEIAEDNIREGDC